MLLNALPCTGQLPATKNDPAPNVNSVKAGNPAETYLDYLHPSCWANGEVSEKDQLEGPHSKPCELGF